MTFCIACQDGLKGVTVVALSAAEALYRIEMLESFGVSKVALSHIDGSTLTLFELTLLAAEAPILAPQAAG